MGIKNLENYLTIERSRLDIFEKGLEVYKNNNLDINNFCHQYNLTFKLLAKDDLHTHKQYILMNIKKDIDNKDIHVMTIIYNDTLFNILNRLKTETDWPLYDKLYWKNNYLTELSYYEK